MNATLIAQLRGLDPEIARSYDRVCRTVQGSIECPVEHQELMDDIDVLVDQLIAKTEDE